METSMTLMSSKEMAEALGKTPRTIAKMCREGRIGGAFLDESGDWRITRSDFIRKITLMKERQQR